MASLEYTAQSPYNVTPATSQPAMPQVANNDFLQTIPFGLRSNTWRTQDAEMAKSLAKNGVDAISIYKQTGTWLSSDGKWRQEVAKGSQFPQGAGKAGIYKLPADYNLKNEVKDIALFANSFAPVTGDIQSGVMAAQDVAEGNYGSAALNAVGLLPFVPALGGVISGYGKNANEIANILKPFHPNIDADLMGDKAITLSKIIAKDKNAGNGTNFMNDLTELADKKGLKINLSPSADFGGNKNRLKDFYKRFGFVENKGKNKDFTINESMYREPKVNELNSLNPTGAGSVSGLYADYTPQLRASQPLGKNMTTLDKTMGGSPDDIITIYRGAPRNQKNIVAGDFVTDMPELAKAYAGDGNVLSLKVRRGDVLDDIREPLGNEYIYRPSKVIK